VNATKTGEFSVLKSRNGSEYFNLRAVFQLGLETDHVPERAKRVVLAQLDNGI